jgi:general secretion pathway protein C
MGTVLAHLQRMQHPLNRYSPLIELLAVFAALIAARMADSVSDAHLEVPPPAPRVKPAAARPGATLDPARMARLTGLSETERVCPEPAVSLEEIARQARIVPSFRDGRALGFRLFAIQPGSIYVEAGLQNGDIIKTVNGFDLTVPEKALEVYSTLKAACRYDIEIERGGQTLHLLCTRRHCLTR